MQQKTATRAHISWPAFIAENFLISPAFTIRCRQQQQYQQQQRQQQRQRQQPRIRRKFCSRWVGRKKREIAFDGTDEKLDR